VNLTYCGACGWTLSVNAARSTFVDADGPGRDEVVAAGARSRGLPFDPAWQEPFTDDERAKALDRLERVAAQDSTTPRRDSC